MYDELSKCIVFLSPRMRVQWLGLIPISVVKAALEALSATCVFALISLVNDPAKAGETTDKPGTECDYSDNRHAWITAGQRIKIEQLLYSLGYRPNISRSL